MSLIKYCNITGCRFNWSHVTKDHSCSICKQKGHGQIEHGHVQLLQNIDYYPTVLPLTKSCSFKFCRGFRRHMSIAHMCLHCSQFGHNMSNCSQSYLYSSQSQLTQSPASSSNSGNIKCPNCRVIYKEHNTHSIYIQTDCPICCNQKSVLNALPCGHILCEDCCKKMIFSSII